MARECIFCGEEAQAKKRAKEHVIPEWALRKLDIWGDDVIVVHKPRDGSKLERRQTLGALVAGRCCNKCNNGWLSAMEHAAIPVFVDLWSLARRPDELDEAEKRLLSAWSAKTAYALMSVGPYWGNVPSAHVEHLRKTNEASPEIAVFCSVVSTGRQYGVVGGRRWFVYSPLSEEDNAVVDRRSYRVGLHVENLFLLVCYWPLEGWWLAADPGRYYPLCGTESRMKWILPISKRLELLPDAVALQEYAQEVFPLKEDMEVGATMQDVETREEWVVCRRPEKWAKQRLS
jgi:hypothetical protein